MNKLKNTINCFMNYIGYHIKKYDNYMPERSAYQFIKEYYGSKDIIGIEIGVLNGNNALDVLKKMPNIKTLYLIDPWKEYKINDSFTHGYKQKEMDAAYKLAIKNLKPYSDRIIILKMTSKEAFKLIKEKVDFVYVDGNHEYNFVLEDLRNYLKLLKMGGVLSGNDIVSKEHDEVVRAVFDFKYESKLKPFIQSPDYWFIKGRKEL